MSNGIKSFDLFCLLILLCLNKQIIKVFYLTLHSMFREFIYISKYKILHLSILITVAKTCENVLLLNMTLDKT